MVRAFGQDVVDKLLACFGSARFDAEAKGEETRIVDAQLSHLGKAKQQLQKSANTNSICSSAKEILWDKEFAKKLLSNFFANSVPFHSKEVRILWKMVSLTLSQVRLSSSAALSGACAWIVKTFEGLFMLFYTLMMFTNL